MEQIDTDSKTTKLKSLAKLFKPFNRDWAPLTIRLQAQGFYEEIVNEAQPSWLSLIENKGE